MNEPVFQSALYDAPWSDPHFRRLPGTRPLDADGWLWTDEAYAAQMALRDRLIAERRAAVIGAVPGHEAAAAEVLDEAVRIAVARLGFGQEGDRLLRPDGIAVAIDRSDPLGTLGRLVQEDICILEKRGEEHVLTAAALCFPSGWTLAEKLGRPLIRIHRPVAAYDDDVARRVQRLFDGIRPGRPLWRANILWHVEPHLFYPRPEADPREKPVQPSRYLRSERQCLVRMPRTSAVVFTIHTTLIDAERMTPGERAALQKAAARPET